MGACRDEEQARRTALKGRPSYLSHRKERKGTERSTFRITRTSIMRCHAAKYLASVLLACAAAVLMAVPIFGQTVTVTLVGAGDIANCTHNNDEATAKLLGSSLRSLTPDGTLPPLSQARVIALGDNAYPSGTRAQFANCYDNYRLSDGTRYYSYDLGSWHIVALNSNDHCAYVSCSRISAQGIWLRYDLVTNPSACTLAYIHHPLYATGSGGVAPEVKPLIKILYNNNADVVLNAHNHRYERLARIDPNGNPDRARASARSLLEPVASPVTHRT